MNTTASRRSRDDLTEVYLGPGFTDEAIAVELRPRVAVPSIRRSGSGDRTEGREWRGRTEFMPFAPSVLEEDARQEVNPSFHRILREFKSRTALGVVVNTSFNIHEEPIVCTPADACVAFEQGATDSLAIGNFIVER